MKLHLPLLIALLVIVAGYATLTNLNAAAVISNNVECDDTMLLPSNPNETTAGDSIFAASSVQQRTPLKSGRYSQKLASQKWTTSGTDSCSNDILTEWSCTSSRAGAKAISRTVECKYGCREGHCLLPTCYDPDIAQPYIKASTTTGIMLTQPEYLGVPPQTQDAQGYTDYCSTDLLLTEYRCQQLGGGSYVKSQLKSCKSFGNNFRCIEGRCLSPESG